MDDRAREILHQTRETLARVADVVVEHRNHEDDGFLTAWSRGMPRKPTPPTMAEVEQKIAAALAKQPRADRRRSGWLHAHAGGKHRGDFREPQTDQATARRDQPTARRSHHRMTTSSRSSRNFSSVAVMTQPDDKLGPLALDLLARSRIIEMRERAEELADLCKEEPLPELPVSMLKLYRLLRRERDRSRRLLALVAQGI